MTLSTTALSGVVRQEDAMQWDEFVQSNLAATGYHLIGWKKILEKTFGQRTAYLLARNGKGEVRGILPLSLLSSRIFGTFAVSLPAVNYGGVVTDDEVVRRRLLEAAKDITMKSSAAHLELRQRHELPIDWPCKQTKVAMLLQLPNCYDELWSKFPSKLRSQIRRAQKEGMTTKIGGVELIYEFYKVFSRNMRDLGTPVYSRRWFEEILKTFPESALICSVFLQNQPIAAGFLYGFRDRLEIPWASANRKYNRLAPNMLLYSTVLQYACEAGYRLFDFGRSTAGSATYRFKEQWGAQPVPLYWYYGLRSGLTLPEINPQNPKYRFAIDAWKRLPLAAANLIGPMISRSLP
jgi:FemAB-related protein (PEP-CTERM system-associated)